MDRKKFFTKISIVVLGIALIKSNPLKFVKNKFVSNSNPVKVKVNKLAVKREKSGVKNV